MNNPLVSIIIPNYNHSLFWDERIQSVLNQTYQNFELINTTKSLIYRGISQTEHRIVFDYLVKYGYLEHSLIWKEKVRCLSRYIGTRYESRAIRRKIWNVWDKYRIWRTCLFLHGIISEIFNNRTKKAQG